MSYLRRLKRDLLVVYIIGIMQSTKLLVVVVVVIVVVMVIAVGIGIRTETVYSEIVP